MSATHDPDVSSAGMTVPLQGTRRGMPNAVIAAIVIRHDRIHARFRDDGGKMLGRQVRRADDQPAGNSVQLDERQRRGELIPSGDENRPSGELRHSAAEARAVRDGGRDTRWPWHPTGSAAGPSGASASLSRIDAMGLGGVFIEPDEVTQRHRIGHVVGFGERIESQCLFESSHEDGDGERVEPRIEQDQVIGQRRQTLLVVLGNLAESAKSRWP